MIFGGLLLPKRLTAVDEIYLPHHFYLTPQDQVFYFGEYTPRQGYGYSKTNQFITNFKKSPSKRGTPEWQYKLLSIRQFTGSLAAAIKEEAIESDITFVPIPPSKVRTHPEYDDRMWQVLCGLNELQPQADCRELVMQTDSTEAFHNLADQRRLRPEELADLYSVVDNGAAEPRNIIAVVDDMLTTGSHFKAMELALSRAWAGRQIIGLFAARRVLPPPDFEFDEF